ncbi:MAG: hypothetical protein RL497_1785 [Pseudomonadota bacterium]|jgi:hypothetical protein
MLYYYQIKQAFSFKMGVELPEHRRRPLTHSSLLTPPTELDTAASVVPTVSIDCVVFGFHQGRLNVLLVKYAEGFRAGGWGLPGDWIMEHECLDAAAMRVLRSLTGVTNIYLEQLRAFGSVNRYPGSRVITVAFTALVRQEYYVLMAGAAASAVHWCPVEDCPELALDHSEIFAEGTQSLRQKLRREPIGFNLLPQKFTLLQLQELYEAVLGIKLDKPNFRRKMMHMNLLIPCNEKQVSVAHRAAALYRFDEAVYRDLQQKGLSFSL